MGGCAWAWKAGASPMCLGASPSSIAGSDTLLAERPSRWQGARTNGAVKAETIGRIAIPRKKII
jgi:hypothetical protein